MHPHAHALPWSLDLTIMENKMFDKLQELNDDIIEGLPRDYCGMSSIGDNCYRRLQLGHYWAYKTSHNTRIDRLFGVGHMMEPVFTNDMAKKGVFVSAEQSEVVGFAGHWKGHCDGIAISEMDIDQKFMVEFKTHNDKSFTDLYKKGVLESKPGHYDQCTSYMGYLELPYTLYAAYNKNNSAYRFEIIQFNQERFEELQKKEQDIIMTDGLYPRIGNNTQAWFECRADMCDASDYCFNKKTPPVTCRTCQYVDVLDNGMWGCTKTGAGLTSEMQKLACNLYTLGEMFK